MKIFFLLFALFPAFCMSEPLSIVIIGGGPAGLATAIEAKSAGADVVIIEKRELYSRDRFLFLLEPSLDLLNKWQVSIQDLIVFDAGGFKTGFSNIKNLEIALADRVNELGIPKILGEFQELEDGKVAILQQGQRLELAYDLLVGADGLHSSVRDSLNIDLSHYGVASGSIAVLPGPTSDTLDYILPFKSGSVFINKITMPMGTLIIAQAQELSKDILTAEIMNCGWFEDAESISSGTARYIDNIEITLQQSGSFSDRNKSAIILGDAAASASFLRGKGVNYALEEAVAAGLFFKTEQNEADYAAFNSSMQEITDRLLNDSAFLFDIPPPKSHY